MPHFDRSLSPEEPDSDPFPINRMQEDLNELMGEQQALLDLIARGQERVEHHIEMRRSLLNAPVVRSATPLPEPMPLEMEKGMTDDPPKPELSVVPGVAPDFMPLAKEQPLQLKDQQRACPVARVTPMVQKSKGPKSSPPKRDGLGNETPFPYPKRLGTNRERRALYILKICENLALQLKRLQVYLNTNSNGSNVIFNELGLTSKQQPNLAGVLPMKGGPTCALSKSKCKRFKILVKRLSAEQKALKDMSKPSWKISSTVPGIDLNCELGMENIKKFRYDNKRDEQQSQIPAQAPANKPNTQARMCVGNTELCLAMSELSLGGNNNTLLMQQQGPLSLSDGIDNKIILPASQQATRPSTPDLKASSSMPACLLSSGNINPMASTSAQARAMNEAAGLAINLENLTISRR